MRTFVKYLWISTLVVALFGIGILLADKYCLGNEIVRLHVVANSDSDGDQQIKLAVRDALIEYLSGKMDAVDSAKEAKECLSQCTAELTQIAQQTLREQGSTDDVRVYLTREEFSVRHYDTFSLPSGVYDALRVDIGEAAGKNWWCVVFPAFCMGTTADAFVDEAVDAGFDEGLADALSAEGEVKIRFFFLDCIGKLENFLHLS